VDCVQATDPHDSSTVVMMAICENVDGMVSLQFNDGMTSRGNKSIFVHVLLGEGVPCQPDLNRSTRISVDQYTSAIVSEPTFGIKK
jgi:hypothetical protein